MSGKLVQNDTHIERGTAAAESDPDESGPEATSTDATGTETAGHAATDGTHPEPTEQITEERRAELVAAATAAYDHAYADLLAAEAVPNEYHPGLDAYFGPGQLEQWRSVIRRLREAGHRVRPHPTMASWRRIESADLSADGTVIDFNVCRLDSEQAVDAAGNVVGVSEQPHRYIDTMVSDASGWRWEGREWIDPPDGTDCAAQ